MTSSALLPVPAARLRTFFANVTPGECWIWTGSVNGKGYGVFRHEDGPSENAHRTSYRWFVDQFLDPGHEVHHICGQTRCVNPVHLRALSPDQHEDEHRRLRQELCSRGHVIDDGNLVLCHGSGRSKTPQRKCAICVRERTREARRAAGVAHA